MGGWLGLGVVLVLVGIAVIAGFVHAGRAVLPGPVRFEFLRVAAIWRWIGVVAGLVISGAVATSEILGGRGLLLAAPLFGICVLAGVLVGEALAKPSRGPTRIAALETRRVRDYLPRGLSRVVAGAAVLLLVVLVATTVLGSADDLGRPGTLLYRQCPSLTMPGAVTTQSRGPWPGAFYSIPLLLVVAAGLTAAWAALRQIVRRPRSGEEPAAVSVDDALRRRAARGVTAACGILVTVPFFGVSVVTAIALLGFSCRPAWWSVVGWGLVLSMPGMIAVTCWCLGSVVATTPSPRTARSSS
jgi:hypothetical protein